MHHLLGIVCTPDTETSGLYFACASYNISFLWA